MKEKIAGLAKKDTQDEVLTYTGGVGWQAKETKAETQVHSALKWTYYEAYCDARKALNSEQKLAVWMKVS